MGVVKQTVVHPYHGVLPSNERKQAIDTHNKLDGSLNCYAK